MDKKEAIGYLQERLGEIHTLASLPYDNGEYPLWRNQIEDVLEAVFGRDSNEHKRFTTAYLRVSTHDYQGDYIKQLKICEIAILSIIKKYETLGFEAEPATIAGLPPKAFIAHKGQTNALGKLEDFLDAIGVQHLIAEVEPSDGRLVEPQVTWTYKDADFAIILATRGGVIDKKKGVSYMAMNVADELGRAREVFKNRIVLLLETGVEPHTNISGIVHERFTPQSMDKAFIKIARELRNWGFIRAGRAK